MFIQLIFSILYFVLASLLYLALKSSDFSDQSETAADYFSRSNRRGSIVSDVDDVIIPALNSVSVMHVSV